MKLTMEKGWPWGGPKMFLLADNEEEREKIKNLHGWDLIGAILNSPRVDYEPPSRRRKKKK